MPVDNPFAKPPEVVRAPDGSLHVVAESTVIFKGPEMPTVEMPPAEPIKEELVEQPLAEPAYTRVRGRYIKTSHVIKTTAKTKAEVLAQYGGLESNIPVNHPYWQMKK